MREKWIMIKDHSYSGVYSKNMQKRRKTKKYKVEKKYYISNLGRCRLNDKIIEFKQKRTQYLRFCGKRIHEWVAEMFIPNPDNLPMIDHIDTNIFNNRVDNLRWVDAKGNCNNELTIQKRKNWSNSEEERKRRKESALKQWQDKRELMLNAIKNSKPKDLSYINEDYRDKLRKRTKETWKNMSNEEKENRCKKQWKRVEQYTLDNTYINTYNSLKEAAEKNNLKPNAISQYLNGYTNNGKGFIWKYAQ